MAGRKILGWSFVCGCLAIGMVTLLSASAAAPDRDDSVRLSELGELRVAGPVTHKNLAVFVIYHPQKAEQESDYITLEEGIGDGMVQVTEDAQEQVQQLRITNRSKKPLFLAAGELVKGGKQDRTMQFSLVVPSGTEAAPLPSFCVEQSRWTGGKQFAAGGNIAANASQQALVLLGQQGVWNSVSEYKSQLRANSARAAGKSVQPSRTTSLNEELNDRDVKQFLAGYEAAFSGLGSDLPRPLGIAYAVDGKLTAMHAFHSSLLFRKLQPKLLRSAAIDAAAGAFDKTPKAVSVQDLREFVAAAWDGQKTAHKLGMKNTVTRYAAAATFTCELRYRRSLVHVQAGRVDPRLQGALQQIQQQQPAINNLPQLQQWAPGINPGSQQIIRPAAGNQNEPEQRDRQQPEVAPQRDTRSRGGR